MDRLSEIGKISIESPDKIVMLVLDGLGGLPHPDTGETELETARTPNMDNLAHRSVCGLLEPISPGFTPGSGPGHLALFGYDPFEFTIGRGILEALGIDYPMEAGDIAARGNFCTADDKGIIVDRRAGRISTEKAAELCDILTAIPLEGAQALITPVRGHRFLLVLRGSNLGPHLSDSDPGRSGLKPERVRATDEASRHAATLVNTWLAKAAELLRDEHPANMALLRGFSQHPDLPSMQDVYKLRSAAIATYPMYRGLAKLVGMDVIPVAIDSTIEEQIEVLRRNFNDYSFFFIHFKPTDAAGEDGDFEAKVRAIESVDAALPKLLDINPEVIMITGDHSTPAILKSHSWHPVPFLLYSKWCRTDETSKFSERGCARGALGRMSTLDIMPLGMANALKLAKYGA